jgi:hypothetical protein
MSTVVFPDRLVQWPFRRERIHSTSEFKTTNGRRQTRRNFPSGGFRRSVGRLTVQNRAEAGVVRDFLTEHGGKAQAFLIYAWDQQSFTGLRIGVGDDSTSDFLIPFGNPGAWPNRETTVSAAYANGEVVGGTFEVTPRSGPFGEDQISFSSPPSNEAVLTVDLVGREMITVANDFDVDGYDFAAMTVEELAEVTLSVTECLDTISDDLPAPPHIWPLGSSLIYAESTTTPDSATRTFAFTIPIGTLLTAYIGGGAVAPEDVAVVGGGLVFAEVIPPPDPPGEVVTASYWGVVE